VSKAWHQAYLQVPLHQMLGFSLTTARTFVVCAPQMTLYSAAVASAARLTYAQEAGLDLTSKLVSLAAGKWGSKASILEAVDAGMQLGYVMLGALQRSKLDILQWLVEDLECPMAKAPMVFAAYGGCTDILAYLKQRGMMLTADLLEFAALNGQ
jgi:hypothetical protein